MKAIVNKFSAGLSQLDKMNLHIDRMAAELGNMRVMGVGGGGGMPAEMAEQWEATQQTMQQNTAAVKEAYKHRAEMQMQFSGLQAQVQSLREGEGWKEQLDLLGASATEHARRIHEGELRLAEVESRLVAVEGGHDALQRAHDAFTVATSEAVEKVQKEFSDTSTEHGDMFGRLNKMTQEMKDDILQHGDELKSVHDAAAVACSSQLDMIELVKDDLRSMSLKLETGTSEQARLQSALKMYDKVVEEEFEHPGVWTRMSKRSQAVSQLCLATAGGLAAYGKSASSVSDKVVQKIDQAVEKLRKDFDDMESQYNTHDHKVSSQEARLQLLEAEHKRNQDRKVAGDGVVSHSQMEQALGAESDKIQAHMHQTTRRLDELAGQAENLAAEKMDRIDSISRQYLEKSIGEISMEFAAALQRHRQEINRYLNDKAQADVLMDMEGRFGQRLQQMEAILMKGVKGLDERASLALSRKADFAWVQRLQDRLELLLADRNEARRATSPMAAGVRGQQCLSCNGPVRSAHDEWVSREMNGGKIPPDPHGNLPNNPPWHSSFGGMVTGDLKGASFNARLNTPQRGQRKPVATAPGRFRDAGGMPESELGGQDSLDVHSYDEDADLADGEYPPRPTSKQGPRGGGQHQQMSGRSLSSGAGSMLDATTPNESPRGSGRRRSSQLPAVGR